MQQRFGGWIPGVLIVALCLAASEPAFAALFQRMRIAPGEYPLGSKATRILARCIDPGIKTPAPADVFHGASASVFVRRLKSGKLVDEVPLARVQGDWVQVLGNDTPSSVSVRALKSDFEYVLVVKPGIPGVVGESQLHVDVATQLIAASPEVGKAMGELDAFRRELVTVFGASSEVVNEFHESTRAAEQSWLNPNRFSAQAIKSTVGRFRSMLENRFIGNDGKETYQRISVAACNELDIRKTQEASKLLNTPVDRALDVALRSALKEYVKSYAELREEFGDDDLLTRSFAYITEVGTNRYGRVDQALADSRQQLLPNWLYTIANPSDLVFLTGRKLTDKQLETLKSVTGIPFGQRTAAYDNYTALIRSGGRWNLVSVAEENVVDVEKLSSEALARLLAGKKLVIDETAQMYLGMLLGDPALMGSYVNAKTLIRHARRESLKATTEAGERKNTTLRHAHTDDKKRLDVRYIRQRPSDSENPGIGDAILIRTPEGKMLLIDTGLDAIGYEQTRKAVQELGGSQQSIVLQVVITHEDQDHLAGMKRLLSDGQIRIERVVFGRHTGSTKLAADVLATLDTRFKKVMGSPTANLMHYVSPDLLAREQQRSSLQTIRNSSILGQPQLNAYRLELDREVTLELFQYRRPATPNQSSVMCRLSHRGRTQLLTSDIDVKVMAAAVSAPDLQLNADVLKWPHHVSLPQHLTREELNIVAEFLRMVDPDTVVFSNLGKKQTLETQRRARDFIRNILMWDVRVLWTGEDGDISVQSRRERIYQVDPALTKHGE